MVLVGIVAIVVLAVMVAMIVCVIKYSEGKLKKAAMIIYAIAIGIVLLTVSVGVFGSMKLANDRKQYDISCSGILSGYTFRGNTIPGYYEIVSTGLFYADSILIPEGSVQVSPLCKMFTETNVYFVKGDEGFTYTDEELFVSPWFYSVATNVVKLAPDPTWMAIEIGIYGIIFFVPINIILFIVVLVRLKKKGKADTSKVN